MRKLNFENMLGKIPCSPQNKKATTLRCRFFCLVESKETLA